jgi:hypothetical protein
LFARVAGGGETAAAGVGEARAAGVGAAAAGRETPAAAATAGEDNTAAAAAGPGTTAAAARPARIEPIDAGLHVLRATVSAEFVSDLEEVRAALSHKLPGARLEDVLHECVRTTLAAVRRRRRGAGKQTFAKAPPERSRYIPAAVRDEVWRRDGGQCTFVGVTGRRCSSKYRIQSTTSCRRPGEDRRRSTTSGSCASGTT